MNSCLIAMRYDSKAKTWVARCRLLDLISQGETPSRAHEALEAGIAMWARQCHKHGTLGILLKAKSFAYMASLHGVQ